MTDNAPQELAQDAVEEILGETAAPESFAIVEHASREIAKGVAWRRRRATWKHAETGDERGLCVNELRIAPNAAATLGPDLAVDHPGRVDLEAVDYAYWQTCWAGGALRLDRGEKGTRLFVDTSAMQLAGGDRDVRRQWSELATLEDEVAGEHATDDDWEFDEEPAGRALGSTDDAEWSAERLAAIEHLAPRYVVEPGDKNPPRLARFLPAITPNAFLAENDRIVAATNAGYFLNFPEEYDDGVSALHLPVGAIMKSGRLFMPPWIARPCAVEWTNGERRIEVLGPENIELVVDTPQGPQSTQLQRLFTASASAGQVRRVYDPEFPDLPIGVEAVDLVFCGASLVEVKRAMDDDDATPIGGATVRLSGEAAAPWLAFIKGNAPLPKWSLHLKANRDADIAWALASGPTLVRDGVLVQGDALFDPALNGDFRADGPPPTRFPYDADKTQAPRTALGMSSAGEWVLAVVDGRADMAHSVGATLDQLARLMRALGCEQALNLDGGGSSVMALRDATAHDQVREGLTPGVVNLPSDPGHRERIVPVALCIEERGV